MANREHIRVGQVDTNLPNLQHWVTFPDGSRMRCVQAGKLRIRRIQVLVGDTVEVYHSPEMKDIGRIVWRR